jgi:hypothetical protein
MQEYSSLYTTLNPDFRNLGFREKLDDIIYSYNCRNPSGLIASDQLTAPLQLRCKAELQKDLNNVAEMLRGNGARYWANRNNKEGRLAQSARLLEKILNNDDYTACIKNDVLTTEFAKSMEEVLTNYGYLQKKLNQQPGSEMATEYKALQAKLAELKSKYDPKTIDFRLADDQRERINVTNISIANPREMDNYHQTPITSAMIGNLLGNSGFWRIGDIKNLYSRLKGAGNAGARTLVDKLFGAAPVRTTYEEIQNYNAQVRAAAVEAIAPTGRSKPLRYLATAMAAISLFTLTSSARITNGQPKMDSKPAVVSEKVAESKPAVQSEGAKKSECKPTLYPLSVIDQKTGQKIKLVYGKDKLNEVEAGYIKANIPKPAGKCLEGLTAFVNIKNDRIPMSSNALAFEVKPGEQKTLHYMLMRKTTPEEKKNLKCNNDYMAVQSVVANFVGKEMPAKPVEGKPVEEKQAKYQEAATPVVARPKVVEEQVAQTRIQTPQKKEILPEVVVKEEPKTAQLEERVCECRPDNYHSLTVMKDFLQSAEKKESKYSGIRGFLDKVFSNNKHYLKHKIEGPVPELYTLESCVEDAEQHVNETIILGLNGDLQKHKVLKISADDRPYGQKIYSLVRFDNDKAKYVEWKIDQKSVRKIDMQQWTSLTDKDSPTYIKGAFEKWIKKIRPTEDGFAGIIVEDTRFGNSVDTFIWVSLAVCALPKIIAIGYETLSAIHAGPGGNGQGGGNSPGHGSSGPGPGPC